MMLIGRSKPKTNLNMVRKIKGTLEKALSLPDSATISVTEFACFEEGCPPVETVVALLQAGSSPLQHKFHKPAGEIKPLIWLNSRFAGGSLLRLIYLMILIRRNK